MGLIAMAGCGFVPAYGPSGVAGTWQNTVAVVTPDTPVGFAMRAQLERAFGPVRNQRYTLQITPRTAPVAATITDGGDITRINLTGNAEWTLTDAGGTQIDTGLVQTFTSYSATGSTVATQSAEGAAQDRLAAALADLIVQQILTSP